MNKWLILGFLLFILLALRTASAKPKEEYTIPVPPSPVSGRVEVFAGETKTITLKASGRIEEPMKFLIRKKPRKGTLGHIRPVGPNIAEVDYIPNLDAKAGEDFFTFAAQSVDSPVSAAARMVIDLQLRPAALVFPDLLDFGTVPLGDSKRIDLVISNTGGKAAALEMTVNSPWRFAETPPNGVAAADEVRIGLVFEPQNPGDFGERLALTREGTEVVALRGSGMEAISWPPQGLMISPETRGGEATMAFSNHTAEERGLEFEWPENIVAPRAIRIPSEGTARVPVSLHPSTPPSESFQTTVGVRSGNFSSAFPLVVQPAPPGFLLTPASELDLGRVLLREAAVGKFVVSNPGGQPTGLRAEIPKGLTIRPDPSGVLIGPGMSQEFEVSLRPEKPGQFRHFVSIGPEDGKMSGLNIQGEARAVQRVEKLLDLQPPPISSAASLPPVSAIPPVEECFLEESTPYSITIRWKLTSPDTKDFLVERRVIRSVPEGRVIEQWEPWRQAEIRITGDTATAHFRKLAPGTFWNIRVRGIDSKGLAGPPTPGHFRIETQPLPSWNLPLWLWMPVSALLAAGIFLLLKKRIRFQSGENLDQRIAELEK